MSGIWLFLSNMLCYTWGFIVARYSKGKEIKELIKEKEDLQKRFNSLLEAHKICDEEEQEKQERIDKATGIANERINYCYQKNDKEQLESWEEIFDTLQGSDK